jgi:hypothetical protein
VVRPDVTDSDVVDPAAMDVVAEAPEVPPGEPCEVVGGEELLGLPPSNPPSRDFDAVVGMSVTYGVLTFSTRAERRRERQADRRERRRERRQ